MKRRKFTFCQRWSVYNRFRSGASIQKMADEFKLNETTLHYWMKVFFQIKMQTNRNKAMYIISRNRIDENSFDYLTEYEDAIKVDQKNLDHNYMKFVRDGDCKPVNPFLDLNYRNYISSNAKNLQNL